MRAHLKADGWRLTAGFTLIEIIVIVSIIAILAAAVTPAVVQQLLDTRVSSTRDELETLYQGMVGDPAQSRFGFVGDIGRLPDDLDELVQRSGLPNYSTGNVRGVGMGWRGPYVNAGTSANDYRTDAFNRPYTLNNGQVRSAGPDGVVNNADDLVYPPSAPIVTGSVSVTIKTIVSGKTIVDPNGYRVELFYADDGDEDDVRDNSDPFNFNNVHMGIHAVRVVKTSNPGSGTVVAQDTIVVRPGSTTAVELWF
jgi:type II secretory pathway pseudopilin PulG